MAIYAANTTSAVMVAPKAPGATKDYVWDWSEWLGTDQITVRAVSADAGITVDSSAFTTTTVTAILSGGTHGKSYRVTCTITTAGGRLLEPRTIIVPCSNM